HHVRSALLVVERRGRERGDEEGLAGGAGERQRLVGGAGQGMARGRIDDQLRGRGDAAACIRSGADQVAAAQATRRAGNHLGRGRGQRRERVPVTAHLRVDEGLHRRARAGRQARGLGRLGGPRDERALHRRRRRGGGEQRHRAAVGGESDAGGGGTLGEQR